MLTLVLGLGLFFAIHLLPAAADLRRGLIERFGATAYKLGFSLVALMGFALIVTGYHKLQVMPGKNPQLWSPPAWGRHATMALMLPALILLVAAYIPSRIRTAAKHPMLAAVKLWALGHLLVRGDLGSVLLFGSFLAWAIFDRISVKNRDSFGPLGKAKPTAMGDVAVVAIGLALYAFMLFAGHGLLIGVPISRLSF